MNADAAPNNAGAIGKAYQAADTVYQTLVQPDRPLAPETGKKPWLAALLSLAIVGAGQLYNRQLGKSILLFLIFYPVGGVLLALYLLLDWLLDLHERIPDQATALVQAYLIVWGILWLFAVVDAYRTARALRTGRKVVRFGFLRQSIHLAAGLVPFAGSLTPKETLKREELGQSLGQAAKGAVQEQVVEWLVVRVLRLACLGLGIALIGLGLGFGVNLLVTLGGVLLLVGILLFLA